MFKRGSYFYYALGNGMFYFTWGMFGSVLSVYLAGVGCSASEISLIISAGSICSILTQPIAGMLADKFESPKKVSIVSAVLTIIAALAFAYSKNFLFLFLFNGATQGLLCGIVALTDRLATASPYPFGTIRVWGSVMYAVACQISGFVLQNFDPIVNYYIVVVGLLLTMLGFFNCYDVKTQKRTDSKTSTISTKEVFLLLLKNKPFVMFTIIYMLYQAVCGTQGVYQQLMMTDLGASVSLIGTTFLFSTLSELPMVLFSDKIIAKFSYKTLMIFAFVMTLIRVVWYSTMPSPEMIMYMFFFQGVTYIVFAMVQVRLILDIVDERYVNTAYGISNMLAKGLATVIMQFICGQIATYFGYQVLYYFYSVIMVIIIILGMNFKTQKKRIR